jgi:hypothetical protein
MKRTEANSSSSSFHTFTTFAGSGFRLALTVFRRDYLSLGAQSPRHSELRAIDIVVKGICVERNNAAVHRWGLSDEGAEQEARKT